MEKIKYRFVQQYVVLVCIYLVANIFIFRFFIYNSFLMKYTMVGLVVLIYTYLLVRSRSHTNKIILAYMIIAPLYHFYFMLNFWESTVINVVVLFPLPLAAFVFFGKKEVIAYSLYSVADVLICFLVHKYSGIRFEGYAHDKIIITDMICSGFSLISVILLFKCNNEFKNLKISSFIKEEKIASEEKVAVSQKISESISIDAELAEKLDNIMDHGEIFKDTRLNISGLSVNLNVNYTSISKIVRYKGYNNFSHYLNTYRINHVKKLISENDLQKVKLMYIYTEAGFSSQATFNRVFRQIEGITPSEYINKIVGIEKESGVD